MFDIDPQGSADHGPCQCCGDLSRRIWGYARRKQIPFASYFVHWTLGRLPDHGANFDLIVGQWGEGTGAPDRCAVSLSYQFTTNGPGFIVIDSESRPIATSTLVGRALSPAEVVGQPIANDVFALCDAILDQDDRLAEFFGSST